MKFQEEALVIVQMLWLTDYHHQEHSFPTQQAMTVDR